MVRLSIEEDWSEENDLRVVGFTSRYALDFLAFFSYFSKKSSVELTIALWRLSLTELVGT